MNQAVWPGCTSLPAPVASQQSPLFATQPAGGPPQKPFALPLVLSPNVSPSASGYSVAQAPPVQLCPSLSLHAPPASQVCVSAGHASGSSADATTTQWPAWPGRLHERHASVHALSQQTPSLHTTPAAH